MTPTCDVTGLLFFLGVSWECKGSVMVMIYLNNHQMLFFSGFGLPNMGSSEAGTLILTGSSIGCWFNLGFPVQTWLWGQNKALKNWVGEHTQIVHPCPCCFITSQPQLHATIHHFSACSSHHGMKLKPETSFGSVWTGNVHILSEVKGHIWNYDFLHHELFFWVLSIFRQNQLCQIVGHISYILLHHIVFPLYSELYSDTLHSHFYLNYIGYVQYIIICQSYSKINWFHHIPTALYHNL